MNTVNILFFGSTSDSVLILEKVSGLHLTDYEIHISAVITQPPKPVGRKQIVTQTPVAEYAKSHTIPVLTFRANAQKPWEFDDEETAADTLAPFKADLIVSASYGLKIPVRTIKEAGFGGLNVHPSILPRWRGADPVPWAILVGDHQTGVTIVTLGSGFDDGHIVGQRKIPITDSDTADPLRTRLFSLGAQLLGELLSDYLNRKIKITAQDSEKATIARKFTRDDGYMPWDFLLALIKGEKPPDGKIPSVFQQISADNYPVALTRALRALHPWPGLWTTILAEGKEKRLKILEAAADSDRLTIRSVQLEGKKPVTFSQFSSVYLP